MCILFAYLKPFTYAYAQASAGRVLLWKPLKPCEMRTNKSTDNRALKNKKSGNNVKESNKTWKLRKAYDGRRQLATIN